jgi:hypothetical protein
MLHALVMLMLPCTACLPALLPAAAAACLLLLLLLLSDS